MHYSNVLFMGLGLIAILFIAFIAALLAKKRGVGLLIGMFTATIIITAVIASKLVTIGPFTVSASIIVFSASFFLTDVISEFWGKKEAQKAVWAGLWGNILAIVAIALAILWEPATVWEGQEAFVATLSSTFRITLASVVAYVVAQSHDVWAFHFWKEKTGGKHLWFRNNLSTGVSQILDSIIFATIAFYGIIPVTPVIIATIVVKFIIAAVDTPVIYAVKWFYRKETPTSSGAKKELSPALS